MGVALAELFYWVVSIYLALGLGFCPAGSFGEDVQNRPIGRDEDATEVVTIAVTDVGEMVVNATETVVSATGETAGAVGPIKNKM